MPKRRVKFIVCRSVGANRRLGSGEFEFLKALKFASKNIDPDDIDLHPPISELRNVQGIVFRSVSGAAVPSGCPEDECVVACGLEHYAVGRLSVTQKLFSFEVIEVRRGAILPPLPTSRFKLPGREVGEG